MKLEARNITLSYDSRHILNTIDLTTNTGELVGLIGPNGAGKTSLLKILANIHSPDSGNVSLDNRSLCDWNQKTLARHIGYLAQGAPAHWPLTVKRLVELGRLPHLRSWQQMSQKDQIAVDHAMTLTEVKTFADRPVTTLSGGERLRALIARMLATEPTIILADEPIAALDPYHQLHTMEILRDHCDRGGSGVVVMHDLNIAARFCHRLVLLHQGSIVSNGSPAEVLQAQRLADVYGIDAEIIKNDNGLMILPQARIPHEHS